MRPNSLFFDRGGKQGLARTLSMITTVVFLVLMGYVIIRYKHFAYLLDGELMSTPVFGWLLFGYISFAVLSVFLVRWANCRVRRLTLFWGTGVFFAAFVPRVLLLLAQRAPAFGGAVFGQRNLAALFLPEQRMALFLCALTALSAVILYRIARRFDEGSAPAAGLLFALYPANIVLSTGQAMLHVAVLLALLSVLFALVAFSALRRGRAMAFSALSGLMLALCGVALETAWLFALAFFVFFAVLLLSSFRMKKEPMRLVLLALAFSAVFFSLRAFASNAPNLEELDENLAGANAAGIAQQLRQGDALFDTLNWATLQKGYDLKGEPIRLDQSITHLWLEKDGAMAAPDAGVALQAGLSALLRGLRLLDFFFLAGVYLFAWVGGLLRRRGGAGDLLIWLFLIWAGAHLFSERQMITRALGLPLLMLFAAYGVFAVVGTEPKPKEREKYATCVNRGALNLGDIPATDEGLTHADAFHPAGDSGHPRRTSGGLYAALEADLTQRQETETTTGGK